jgi:hypothetical protein
MAALNKKQRTLLKTIEDGTKTPQGFIAVEASEELTALHEAKLIEVNETPDENGLFPTRIAGGAGSLNSPNGVAPMTAYEVLSGIPLAEAKRGGKKEEQYPFSQMNVGDSFLVPVTDAYPKPWETFASTVSSATRRFASKSDETYKTKKGEMKHKLTPTRKFTLRRVEAGTKYPNGYTEPASGARVFRVA